MPQAGGPGRIVQMVMNYRAAKILLVAADLDLFTLLSRGRLTAAQAASRLKSDSRATEILLNALAPLGYIRKSGDRYGNTLESERFLVRGRPGYIGNNLKYQELIWQAWSDLRGVVKNGHTRRPLEDWLLRHKTFSREYILGMRDIAAGPARELAALLPLDRPRRMLDVGAGPGSYSLAFLERHPGLESTLLDLPSTLKITREVLRGHPLARRARLLPGDYHRAPFGREAFDLVLMSHITHDEGERENLRLVEKARRALRPGGILVIHDFMLDRGKTSPAFAALFSVHMLVYTRRGRVYSEEEYRSWFLRAGFNRMKSYAIAKESANATLALAAWRTAD